MTSLSRNVYQTAKSALQFGLTSKWSFDPVDIIANRIIELKLPAHIIMKLVIGDFGCGRAKLSELLKENKTFSFDHHNILNDKIIACDIKSVPLKRDGQLDIAVFCLSLMGENWPDYIVEARRCLTKNGLLFIAETTKSLSGRLYRLREILNEHGDIWLARRSWLQIQLDQGLLL